MIESPHEVFFADRAWQGTVAIRQNVRLAKDTFRVRVDCPQIARRAVPGQFVMLRLAGVDDPLLGRPLAVYDTVLDDAGKPLGLDLVYLVVGKFTGKLATCGFGTPLEIWGPLGNGFAPRATRHLLMVAGGIGQTPFVALAREYLGSRQYGDPPRQVPRADKVTLCYGARSKEYLAGVPDFERLGVEVHTSTDDGSAGFHGLVTDLARQVLEVQRRGAGETHCVEGVPACRIVCCGPEKMMEATSELARQMGVPCQVSLETPMACGIGICFSCVARVRQGPGEWDYRRTCVEGPVFDAEQVVF